MDAGAPRKPALGFIFITLVLIVLGFSIIIPVLPDLVKDFEGGDVAHGSWAYGWLIGTYAAAQFISAPILGSLSDRFGRRKVILIALAGSAVDYVIMGKAPSLTWLFIARLISGMTAGSLGTCNAYIADVTPPEKRAQGYGLVGAAFGLGFVIGPVIGGYFGRINHRLPFFVAAGCVGLNWLYGALVLPESLPPPSRRPFSWKRANPVGSFVALRRFRGVVDLALMYFIVMFGQAMLQSVWVLYTELRYHWTIFQVSLSLTFLGITAVVVQGGLVRRIIAMTGERRGLVIGLIVSGIIMTAYGFATEGWMIYVLVVIGAFGGISGPAAQALITKHVPANEQGAVQGSLSGLVSLANIFAPLIASWSFGAFIKTAPGIAFYEAGALMILALALAFRSFRIDDRVGVA